MWASPAIQGNWSPIIELENVEPCCTHLNGGNGILPYSDRLQALQITTLAEKQIRGNLIKTFKMLIGILLLVKYGQGNLMRADLEVRSPVYHLIMAIKKFVR